MTNDRVKSCLSWVVGADQSKRVPVRGALWRKFVCSERGSTLLLVFAVAVVLAILMPSLYLLVHQSSVNQSRRGDMEFYNSLVYSLKSQVEDPLNCYKVLGGKKLPPAFKGKLDKQTLPFTFKGAKGS